MSMGTRGCVDLRPRWIGGPELTFGVARIRPWDLEVEVVDSVQRIARKAGQGVPIATQRGQARWQRKGKLDRVSMHGDWWMLSRDSK